MKDKEVGELWQRTWKGARGSVEDFANMAVDAIPDLIRKLVEERGMLYCTADLDLQEEDAIAKALRDFHIDLKAWKENENALRKLPL